MTDALAHERRACEVVGAMVARRRSHGAERVVGGFQEVTTAQAAALEVVHRLALEALAAREHNLSLRNRLDGDKIKPGYAPRERERWDKAGRP